VTHDSGRDSAALIRFSKIDLAFSNRKILEQIDLEIARGEIVCLVGPSGCGKTTALRIATGLLAPTAGSVTFDGAPVVGPRRDVERRAAGAPRASRLCLQKSASPITPINIPRKCQAACSSACRSRVVSRRSPPH
jgi:ABC-type transporter Mla maintaining outer membrane lipid asymmetry ATPase subunit MlaF